MHYRQLVMPCLSLGLWTILISLHDFCKSFIPLKGSHRLNWKEGTWSWPEVLLNCTAVINFVEFLCIYSNCQNRFNPLRLQDVHFLACVLGYFRTGKWCIFSIYTVGFLKEWVKSAYLGDTVKTEKPGKRVGIQWYGRLMPQTLGYGLK